MSKLPTTTAIRWLVRDTFRQSLASGICWLLLGTTIVCTFVAASVAIDGDAALQTVADETPEFLPRGDRDAVDPDKAARDHVPVVAGEIGLLFGAFRVPLGRDARAAVHTLELLFAGGVADTLGVLLTLVWTAGFLPQFLDPRQATVLLTKPVSRWTLLVGKYLGVLAFVGVHALLFVSGTWLALGLRTAVWDARYLWSIPLLVLHFGVFFSFSLLLATVFRSTVVCVFGSIVFWAICWATNYGRHALTLARDVAPDTSLSKSLLQTAEASYWLLPKPADFGLMLFELLGADGDFQELFDVTRLSAAGFFSLELSIVTSVAFAVYALTAASRQFAQTDY